MIIGTSGWQDHLYDSENLRYAIQDYQIYIIDPENEYTKIVEALVGQSCT